MALVIEDDSETGAYLSRGLLEAGWGVALHDSPKAGILALTTAQFDVVILDRMLPDMDGIDVLKIARGAGITTPILMLTARSDIADRVEGLEAGADDYLIKPFAMSELLARIKIIARRTAPAREETVYNIADLTIDRLARRASRALQVLDLSPLEFRLLDYLAEHSGEVVTRTILLERVWGYRFDPKTSIVQTHMSRLRAKVDKPFPVELIQTVRGAGYVLKAP